jgi:butyryl-CoA dehydrogenase
LKAIRSLMDEVMQPPLLDGGGDSSEVLGREAELLAASRKIGLFSAGVASQRFMAALQDQQEIMADLADIISQVYALDSALMRARKLAGSGKGSAEVAATMTGMLADETLGLAEQAARRILAACAEGDELRTQLAILRRLSRSTPFDTVALSRAVAKKCIEMEKYPM